MKQNKKHGIRPRALHSAPVRTPPRVALVIETSTTFGRKLLSGVAQYIRENGPWSVFFTDRAVNDSTPRWLATWKGDGIISRIASPEIRQFLAHRHIPVVDLNEQLGDLGAPQISNDHLAIGCMAAQHLIDRGFEVFGFLGHQGHPWSDRRQSAFVDLVSKSKGQCSIYSGRTADVSDLREGVWATEIDQIADWVRGLPKPVGLMACNDFRALQLLSACHLANVAVPEQAAVIGVGADDVACELADPSLSSVILNAWRMGYEAAALLDKMMKGHPAPRKEIRIPPLDISVRRSTDTMAISDPIVASAVRFIREQACNGINVETVLRHLGVSRTWLQLRFRETMQKSIHDVLIEARIERVQELLGETTLPLDQVAERCGFRYPEYMSNIFKQRTGWSPARFRREFDKK